MVLLRILGVILPGAKSRTAEGLQSFPTQRQWSRPAHASVARPGYFSPLLSHLPVSPPLPQAADTLPKTSVLAPSLAMDRAAEVILTIGRVMDPARK